MHFPRLFVSLQAKQNYYLIMTMETNPQEQTDSTSRQRHLRERVRQLAADFCAGNDHAFAELYDLYVHTLYNYGMKLTQDQELLKDCIHDVFVKVYTKRNEKHTINNLSSYLIISLKNRLLDEFRRNTFTDDSEVECFEYRRATDDVEHDYLNNGFFAMSKEEELPAEFSVNFLERMEDVTSIVLKDVDDKTSEADREKAVNAAIKKLQKDNAENGRYKVVVKPFYEGNEYYMFIYTTYEDVRLVVAPPSSIGKFGGDTDNWMWPRHTGDFTVFRIYTAPDGSPAKYSKDNVPFHPKHFLPISLKGYQPGDYTMIWGYP